MNRIRWYDAIRVLGLFLVLGYHLFYNAFPGGFLGVDVFFTFSGFLISAGMLEEVRAKGAFDIKSFFKRRFTRIFPPLCLSVAFTLPLLLFISPDFSVGIFKQSAAAIGFVTNWFEIRTGGSYEGQLIPHLYVHTWFLAVEMQFYICWGLVCAALSALTGRLFKRSPEIRVYYFQASVLMVSFIIAAGSLLYMRVSYDAGGDMSAVYFDTFARLFPFFLGAAAAVLKNSLRFNITNPRKFRFVAVAALIFTVLAGSTIIIFAVRFKFTDAFIYHYGFLITSALTTALILGAQTLHHLAPGVKQPAALKAAADLSFNVYLYHWPFYIICSALIINNYLASVAALAASAIAAALSLYGAERMFKSPKDSREHKLRRTAVILTAAVMAAALPAGAAVVQRAPDITSIENDFAVSYIYQGVEEIKTVKRGVDAIDETPVILSGHNGSLQPNLLFEPGEIPLNASAFNVDVVSKYLEKFVSELAQSKILETKWMMNQEQNTEPAPANANTAREPETAQIMEPGPERADEPDITGKNEPDDISAPERERTNPAFAFTPNPARTEPLQVTGGVTIIGDSVVLGAQTTCIKIIPDCYVDALVSRQINAGRDLMLTMQARKELREYVVVALGTNGHYNYAALFTQIIEDLEPGHRLIFVTPFDGRANENAKITAAAAAWMRELPDLYDFVTVADWNALIGSQTNLLAGDKVHMGGQTSMTLYAEMVVDAIEAASQKPAKE